MLPNAKVGAFTVSELLRENKQGGKIKLQLNCKQLGKLEAFLDFELRFIC